MIAPGSKATHNGKPCVVRSVRRTAPAGSFVYCVQYADGTQAGNLGADDVKAGAASTALPTVSAAPAPPPPPASADDEEDE